MQQFTRKFRLVRTTELGSLQAYAELCDLLIDLLLPSALIGSVQCFAFEK